MVYRYLVGGDNLRKLVAADLAVSDDLLQWKYDWVKKYLFRGVEFSGESQPKTTV